MKQRHIAFCLEQAYGHIIPTVGVALKLMQHGHRVSYAVTEKFAPAIRSIGAYAAVIQPLETRTKLLQRIDKGGGIYDFEGNAEFAALLRKARTADALTQLESLYLDDRPDLMVHDDCLDTAGRQLALDWAIPKVRHQPQVITKDQLGMFAPDDEHILVSVPAFFHENLEIFDERFKFIGFIAEGRKQFFKSWEFGATATNTIHIFPTTGLLPQIDFCRLAIEAFRTWRGQVVLSLPGELDPVCEISPASLEIPAGFRLNRSSSNLEILEHSCLLVGQGGQGSVLEALYCGTPLLLVPPGPIHADVPRRVQELGLGVRLQLANATPDNLRRSAESLIDDDTVKARLGEVKKAMREARGAELAVDVIEGCMSRGV